MRYTGPSKAVRAEVAARAGYRCERCRGPLGAWSAYHHRLPRRMGGTRHPGINDPVNISLLCCDCHDWTEREPLGAHETGWLVHAGVDPDTVIPVPLVAS